MLKSYRYRLYPTETQKVLLDKHFGSCRFVYNLALETKNILQIPTFEPSTKMCSVCGHINNDLTLNDRDWACPCCGKHHDRDENAAKVIKSYCLNSIFKNKTAAGYVVEKSVELPTLVGAVKQKLLTNC